MGYLSRALVACALVTTMAATSATPDPVDVEIGINAGYDAQCAALTSGDADAWAKTLAPGFVATTPNGKTNDAKGARDGVATLLATSKFDKCHILAESIDMDGTEAVVGAAVTMSGTRTDGKTIEVEQHATDRWTPANGTWLQKSSKVSEQTVTVDGTVVQHDVAKGRGSPKTT
jgi:hypothetical protein